MAYALVEICQTTRPFILKEVLFVNGIIYSPRQWDIAMECEFNRRTIVPCPVDWYLKAAC
jgi:hypothetical protein